MLQLLGLVSPFLLNVLVAWHRRKYTPLAIVNPRMLWLTFACSAVWMLMPQLGIGLWLTCYIWRFHRTAGLFSTWHRRWLLPLGTALIHTGMFAVTYIHQEFDGVLALDIVVSGILVLALVILGQLLLNARAVTDDMDVKPFVPPTLALLFIPLIMCAPAIWWPTVWLPPIIVSLANLFVVWFPLRKAMQRDVMFEHAFFGAFEILLAGFPLSVDLENYMVRDRFYDYVNGCEPVLAHLTVPTGGFGATAGHMFVSGHHQTVDVTVEIDPESLVVILGLLDEWATSTRRTLSGVTSAQDLSVRAQTVIAENPPFRLFMDDLAKTRKGLESLAKHVFLPGFSEKGHQQFTENIRCRAQAQWDLWRTLGLTERDWHRLP